ncbi:MAG TPA: GYD domain-containing protein [Solirubrobacteraceae bacterium]|nr:GYD domain-containing protein [Solirubrobacteraceae bacterium]
MPTYILLVDWTEKGITKFKDSVDRYEEGRGILEGAGVKFRDIYWTLGSHDMVSIVEAPDDETLSAALLRNASLGNFRTTTMRAFSADEMRGVIDRAG